jgi:nucleoredoxin
VSSDKSQSEFDEYYSEMSFISLPFEQRDIKNKLSKKYKVSGIPTLIVLGPDGELITANARDQVMGDPEGTSFPWQPKSVMEILPSTLTDKKGEVSTKSLDDKVLMLYFSAHWW